jgi:hypothetical protein
MAEICSCKTGIVNFGKPNCNSTFGRDSRLIFVNYLDDAGAVNSIASTDTLDQTFFDGKFNSTDLSQRWYITDTINDVDGERDDNVTQEVDGINFSVRQGNRNYNGNFWGNVASPEYVESMESLACRNMGFFIVTVAGEIIGIKDGNDLKPIKIQCNTLQAKYMFPNADQVQGINLKFTWEENERDADISFIGAGNIVVDMLDQVSMATVDFADPATGITTTTATVVMSFKYGGEAFDKVAYTGAVAGDFTLLDTGGTPIVITTVTETATAGTYDIVFPVQPSGDITLSYQKTSGTGYESGADLTITII